MVSAYWTGNRANLLLVLPFIALYLVQLAHHQLWQDEINAWGIAAASPNLSRLFHLIHYEAHPSLWYVLLWGASRFTTDPVAMKVVEGVIGSAVYLLLALRSPFPQWTKVLLYLSYFISFEYTVLSRMYGLLLLLTIIYASLRTAAPHRILTIAFVLATMANTDMMGILLSSALVVEYLADQWEQDPGFRGCSRRIVAGTATYLAGVSVAVLTLKPAKDISNVNAGHMFSHIREPFHLAHAFVNFFVLPWFPISLNFPHSFWDPSADRHGLLYPILLPVMAGMLYATFRRDRTALTILGLAAGAVIAFEDLIYLGFIRHHGVAFLAFLVAFWIERARRVRISRLAYVFLGLSAIGGVLAGIGQWTHPFSNAAAIGNYIRSHDLQNEPLVGTYNYSGGVVAETMGRPMYFLDCNCTGRFVRYDSRSDGYDWSKLPRRLVRAMSVIDGPKAIFISTSPLTAAEVAQIRKSGIEISELAEFTGAEAPYDPTSVYQVTRLGTPSRPAPKWGGQVEP